MAFLFPLEMAGSIAITAMDFDAETATAFLAGGIESATARALGARGGECHLGFAALAAGTDSAVQEYALFSAAHAGAGFLGVGSDSMTFPATHGHDPAPAADIAIAGQATGPVAPQTFDGRAWGCLAWSRSRPCSGRG